MGIAQTATAAIVAQTGRSQPDHHDGGPANFDGGVQFTSVANGNQAAGGINLSSKATVIEATSLEVSAGARATLNLTDLAPGAIKVTNELTLAAGVGGSISMQGATGAISATKVTLAADKVETGGVALKTIAGDNLTQLPAQVLSHVSFGQSQSFQTAPGRSVTATVKLHGGVKQPSLEGNGVAKHPDH